MKYLKIAFDGTFNSYHSGISVTSYGHLKIDENSFRFISKRTNSEDLQLTLFTLSWPFHDSLRGFKNS